MRIYVALLGLALTVAGCAGDDSQDGGPCTAGSSGPCRCLDGTSGARTCDADGFYGACECGRSHECDLEVETAPGAFGTVCLEAEAERTFVLRNLGDAECSVTLQLAGEAPQHFEVSAMPVVVGIGQSQSVGVTYHPTSAAGAATHERHLANVVVVSNDPDPAAVEVPVEGETVEGPNLPVLSLSCPPSIPLCGPGTDPAQPCCGTIDLSGPVTMGSPYYGRSYLARVSLGAVAVGGVASVPVRVENLGCVPLHVTALEFDPSSGAGFCDGASATVVSGLPATVPPAGEATLELQFAPTAPCNYAGGVRVRSDDPTIDESDPLTGIWGSFSLFGRGGDGP